MRSLIRTRAALWLLLAAIGTASGCGRQPAAAPAFMPSSTIKELMISVVDPSADVVFNAVSLTVKKEGLVETKPQTDEEWSKVRHGAVTLMEAANLLLIPGRTVGRPGDTSETPGVELEPAEMDALIAKDRAGWERRATALHDVTAEVLQAIDAKDADKVFELGERVEAACEACHKHFWYPNEVIPEFPSAVK